MAKSYTGVFTTPWALSEDLLAAGNRRLLVNACYWALGLERRISAKSRLALFGEYHQTPFGFGGHLKGARPSDLHRIELR